MATPLSGRGYYDVGYMYTYGVIGDFQLSSVISKKRRKSISGFLHQQALLERADIPLWLFLSPSIQQQYLELAQPKSSAHFCDFILDLQKIGGIDVLKSPSSHGSPCVFRVFSRFVHCTKKRDLPGLKIGTCVFSAAH